MMIKTLGYMQWGLIFLGFSLGLIGWQFGQPVLISIGVTVGGLGIAIGGVEDVLNRHVSLTYSAEDSRTQTYNGLSAILFGVMWILVGLALFAGGLIYMMGLSDLLRAYLWEHPGPALVLAGLALSAYGGVEALGDRESALTASFLGFLGSVPARVFGFILVLVGLAGMTAGLLELAAPQAFDAALTRLSESLPRIPE